MVAWCFCCTGLSCSRIQLYALSRPGSCEAHLPPRVRVRSFHETAVCFVAKDGTTKDGSSDNGKVNTSVCPLYRMNHPVVTRLRSVCLLYRMNHPVVTRPRSVWTVSPTPMVIAKLDITTWQDGLFPDLFMLSGDIFNRTIELKWNWGPISGGDKTQ